MRSGNASQLALLGLRQIYLLLPSVICVQRNVSEITEISDHQVWLVVYQLHENAAARQISTPTTKSNSN